MNLRYRFFPAAILLTVLSGAASGDPVRMLAEADAKRDAGLHAEAYIVYTNLALNADSPTSIAITALPRALDGLAALNRIRESDSLLDAAATVHARNWRMLAAVADAYERLPSYGHWIAGPLNAATTGVADGPSTPGGVTGHACGNTYPVPGGWRSRRNRPAPRPERC